MKAYIIAILVALLLIGGCKSAPEEEVVEEVEAPVEVVEEVVEEAVADTELAQQVEELSAIPIDETLERYKTACEAGNAGLCAALKTKYGIEMSPGDSAADVEAPAEAMEEPAAEE